MELDKFKEQFDENFGKVKACDFIERMEALGYKFKKIKKVRKTCGIFFISANNLLLIAHPTNAPENVWSIPKGLLEPDETHENAAAREFLEETGIEIDMMLLECLEPVIYPHGKKYLHPFVYKSEHEHHVFNPVCESMVIKPDADPFPENDDFRWVTLDEARELIHLTQIACLDKIKL
jgi:8-oxo-dGTP pyrophosphatase MutT (NUDIX family)